MALFPQFLMSQPFYVLVVAILSISKHPMLVQADPNLINNSCSQTADPKLCRDTLSSNPSTANSATPYALGLASVDVATAKAVSTLGMIRGAINQDPAYKTCVDKYNLAINNLKQMRGAYVKHDYMGVRMGALTMFEAIDDCVDAFRSAPASMSNARRYIDILVIVVTNVKL